LEGQSITRRLVDGLGRGCAGGGQGGSKDGTIDGMKVSVSLPDDDVRFLDEYATRVGAASRSAVIHQAVGLLRTVSLEHAYAAAWDEWEAGEDAVLWDRTVGDGIVDAPR
jgi:Arc/MetJ-type ribon-helix-helix transcriptional regulator